MNNFTDFRSIYVHGFAVDEKGMKMSKSKGNITVPSDVIKKYGVDALRWWVATSNKDVSIPVKTNGLDLSAELIGKFRKTLKYMVGLRKSTSNPFPDIDVNQLSALDKYFLNSIYELDSKV